MHTTIQNKPGFNSRNGYMKWVKYIFRISCAVVFLCLFVAWAWTRYLLVDAGDLMGGQLLTLRLMAQFYEEGEIDKARSLMRGTELEVMQFATYRKIYYGLPDVLANHYWHRIGEYGLSAAEEQKFDAYLKDAMARSWRFGYTRETQFVYYDSPWSRPKWETRWEKSFKEEWKSWGTEEASPTTPTSHLAPAPPPTTSTAT